MKIVKAYIEDAEIVKRISHTTIKAVYPHYYPHGAVEFFLAHHSTEKIVKDIEAGNVWIAFDCDIPNGTVTINENEINRLFVLPEYQGKGVGKALMEFAESFISERYSEIKLSASFSAKKIYMKNGYVTTEYNIIECDNGDKLCYDYMIKNVDLENQKQIIEKQ